MSSRPVGSSPASELDVIWRRLRTASARVLFLDYDGTLAPFRVERDEAVPYEGVREILDSIVRQGGCRIVVVTGRKARELMPLLGMDQAPEIWGSHGLERLYPDGRYNVEPVLPPLAAGLEAGFRWADMEGLVDRCEQKPGCLALHWRGLPDSEVRLLRESARTAFVSIACDSGLGIHEFDGGIELRAPGRDKGHAVRTVMREMGPDAVGVYLGDDLTDEDAFQALKGQGWGILVREEFRSTAADLWLRPPEQLLAFLIQWGMVCQGE